MSGGETLIPIVFFLTIGGVIALGMLARHKERMTMIDKGLKAEDIKSMYERGTLRANPLSSLKWGMIFVAIGVAVVISIWLNDVYYVGEGIFPALISLFGGLGLIAFYFIASKKVQS